VEFVNLTPHALSVHKLNGEVLILPPSGTVARVAVTRSAAPPIGDVATAYSNFGEVTDLPEPVLGTCYIVSAMVALASAKGDSPRWDVLSPGELIRDDAGRPVGCRGLTCY